MENKQANKTEAELYREERKKRLASASKKQAKQSPQLKKAKKVIGKVVAVLLIVVIAGAALYSALDFFGVPQKATTAVKIGDQKVSVAKFSLYYMDVYQNVYGQAQQIEQQYGKGYAAQLIGYDPSKTPMEQAYTQGSIEGFDGENPTWADYFREETSKYLQTFLSYASLARDAGMTLSEDEQKNIDQQIESIRNAAKKQDYSLDRYLSEVYGKGVSEKLLRESLEERTLASDYAKAKSEELEAAVTKEQIDAEIEKNLADYSLTTVAGFQVAADFSAVASDATKEEQDAARQTALDKAKEKADRYVADTVSKEDVLKNAQKESKDVKMEQIEQKNIAPSALGEDAQKWLMDAERKVGDVTAIKSGNGYLVLYVIELPHLDMTSPIDVRHILIAFPEEKDKDGKAIPATDAQKAETKEKAQAILNEYLENPTEENFIALAKSKTEDPGSKETGGLYQEISADGTTPDGSKMVQEFTDWCFEDGRKVGDVGLVETQFGYHIMYLAKNDYPATSETKAKEVLAGNAIAENEKAILADEKFAIENSKHAISWASSNLESFIKKQYIKY